MCSWFDCTVNGLIIGNIYALLAVGLALIFGFSHLIDFAQGSIYTVGAYVGWTCVTHLRTPLPVTMLIVLAGCALLGMGLSRDWGDADESDTICRARSRLGDRGCGGFWGWLEPGSMAHRSA